MQPENNSKRRWVLLAILLLLVTHWLFYKIELSTTLDDWKFLSELAVFFGFYSLALFGAAPLYLGLFGLFGCAAMSLVHGATFSYTDYDWILPLPVLPAFLFFLSQYAALRRERRLRCSSLWAVLMHLVPWGMVALTVISAFLAKDDGRTFFSSKANYGTMALLVLCVLYAIVARAQPKRQNSGKRPGTESLRSAFVFAVITMALSAVFLRFYQVVALHHTVALLWVLNLILLQELGHPLVCGFMHSLQTRVTSFLERDPAR